LKIGNYFKTILKFDFAKDNYFAELKNAEIANERLRLAGAYQEFAEKY
jgi:hypothetical protein